MWRAVLCCAACVHFRSVRSANRLDGVVECVPPRPILPTFHPAANMFGDVAYEERFEAAVKSKDTAVLCPSKPGPKGLTCRFMRKAAKSPVVKTARRAATQLEFRMSPSAYDEAKFAARKMHELLSDGHETWREWLVGGFEHGEPAHRSRVCRCSGTNVRAPSLSEPIDCICP